MATKGVFYVGVDDTRIDLFEGQYNVPDGMCYNSYVIIDDKCAVMDGVDAAFAHLWLEKVERALCGRSPDYLVVQHMEPDHSAGVKLFAEKYPDALIVSSAKAFAMMKGFFGDDFCSRRLVVGEGDTLPLGERTLHFITAPMVHWPEVIMTYESLEGVLFSADAFGRFGVYNSQGIDLDAESRRYYIGIVGKYGKQVLAVLKKAAALDISRICPLHGNIIEKEHIGHILDLYTHWAEYEPEKKGVTIAYASIYGNTREAALLLEKELTQRGVGTVKVFDLSRCDKSEAVASAFMTDSLVLASTTYNADVFPPMREYLAALTERGFKKRRVGIIENGSWAPTAAKVIRAALEGSESITFTDTTVRVNSALNNESRCAIASLAYELAN